MSGYNGCVGRAVPARIHVLHRGCPAAADGGRADAQGGVIR